MPTYVYECGDCGVKFERLQSYSDPTLRDCPECGGHVHRVIQPVGVIFKGSGFYVTDNKGKSSTGIPTTKKDEGTSAASAAPATSSADTKTGSAGSATSASTTAQKDE
jgi:putative FmdB family regulatory protein